MQAKQIPLFIYVRKQLVSWDIVWESVYATTLAKNKMQILYETLYYDGKSIWK